MARYYFDLLYEDSIALDEEGLDLPSLRAAQEEAAKSLADMAREPARGSAGGSGRRHMAVEVRDAFGPVMRAEIKFAIGTHKQ